MSVLNIYLFFNIKLICMKAYTSPLDKQMPRLVPSPFKTLGESNVSAYCL